MAGYKHPCRYCDKLIPADANVCPLCGKIRPLGSFRCPKCQSPIQKDWKNCDHCGLPLEITCPQCAKTVFFGDYCGSCGARLTVVCPNRKCGFEQPPVGEKCVKCNSQLK